MDRCPGALARGLNFAAPQPSPVDSGVKDRVNTGGKTECPQTGAAVNTGNII